MNYLGNRAPQMILCLHDENAVSIAQGYYKASDRMMASALHSNVGLMHATMPIFNSWCDRAPVLILGATGAWDAAKRRPWIEWIHTCSDQGQLVRNYTKWDNQPGSVTAAIEALLRAAQIAQTAPRGPVYVNLDVSTQEEKLDTMPPLPEVARYAVPQPAQPASDLVKAAARLLQSAKNPVMLAGRCSRSVEGWDARIALAEKLNMPVLTHIKLAAAFPTDHRLHAAPPANRLGAEAKKLIAQADVILSLDWLDLGGTLKQAFGANPVTAKIIQVSCDAHSHRGWSMDYHVLPPVDLYLMCEPDAAVPLLLGAAYARPLSLPRKARGSLAASSRCGRGALGIPRSHSPEWRRRSTPRRATSSAASRGFRSAGTAAMRTSVIRSITSGSTAAAESARARASRSARRLRSKAAAAWRSVFAATATFSWATRPCGPPRIMESRA